MFQSQTRKFASAITLICDIAIVYDKEYFLLENNSNIFVPQIELFRSWQPLSGVNFINMLMRSFYISKCSGAQLLFHQQSYAQLYHYTHLEVMHNFYASRSMPYMAKLWPADRMWKKSGHPYSMPYASKINLNLQEQKLLSERWLRMQKYPVKFWWNWGE